MNTHPTQQLIRDLSVAYLVREKEAQPESVKPTGQKAFPGPSTLADLAAALRHPLPPPPPRPRCYSALDAPYKPLTMEIVRELMAKKSAAREVIMREYTERTGQQVDYCEECDMGVVEEEIEEKYGTRVEAMPCGECDGLGVVKI